MFGGDGTAAVDALSAALKAAAEPSRLRLLALLARGELTVSELGRITGQSQPRISRHLRLLTEAGLLVRFREGSWVFHRLAEDGPGAAIAGQSVALLSDADPALALDLGRLAEVKEKRARAAAAYFRKNAPHWNRLRSLHVDESEVENVLKRMLPGRRVGKLLDVGTGTGRMLEVFGPRMERGTGIDLSPDMLAVARANLERSGLDNCAVRKADMYQLPFAGASFDVVTIHQVLHFADDPGRAIAEAARVLRPGGRLLLVDFAPHDLEYLRDEHAHRRLGFADSEVRAWLSAAQLKTRKTVRLPGRPLVVAVWLAAKMMAKVNAKVKERRPTAGEKSPRNPRKARQGRTINR